MRPQLNTRPASTAQCAASKSATSSTLTKSSETVNVVGDQSKPAAPQSQQSESDKRMGLTSNSDDPNQYVVLYIINFVPILFILV